jgi:DNA-binding ferritin-like protein (Dps family)
MTRTQKEMVNLLNNIPENFQYIILEYAKYIKKQAEKGELSDMEYLSSIPGMVELIKKSAETDITDCSDKIDW